MLGTWRGHLAGSEAVVVNGQPQTVSPTSRGCPATAPLRLPGVRAALVTFACRARLPAADRCGTGRAASGERLRSRLAAFLRERGRTSRRPTSTRTTGMTIESSNRRSSVWTRASLIG
jgi:hypothetical protein